MLHCRGCGRAITEHELLYALAQGERFGLSFEDCGRMMWYCDPCFSALIQTMPPYQHRVQRITEKEASVWAETT
jgi:hypothetical protein